MESIPLVIQLFPVEFKLPLLQPLVNDDDDDGKERSLFVTEELVESFPLRIGVR